MSGYILCQTKKAEHPYFVESISTNIYTIEELCYYLYHNLYLVDQTIINEDLCKWLAEELELTQLASKLRQVMEREAGAEEILYPVFKEINYLTYEELKALNGRLTELNKESTAIRKKRKGDALVENGMYVNAIRVYQKLLDQTDFSKERDRDWKPGSCTIWAVPTVIFSRWKKPWNVSGMHTAVQAQRMKKH